MSTTLTTGGAGQAPPCAVVIFGATGDLTKRKLVPALCNLAGRGLLSGQTTVTGVAGNPLSQQDFRDSIRQGVQETATYAVSDAQLESLLGDRLQYVCGDFESPGTYQQLAQLLAGLDGNGHAAGNYLFYMATPPRFFGPIVRQLAAAKLTQQEVGRWRRVIVEKPFGHDYASARALNQELTAVLGEDQLYRIDHYLGKETVQNILVLRFANGVFEPLWNRDHIDHVQITVAETVGVEHRGGYYDHSGALRDMIPNHIFQVLALVAMECPISFDAYAVRDEKAKVIRAIHPFSADDLPHRAVRGQYGPGTAGGQGLAGYRGSEQVSPNSNTPTYAAIKVLIDNWRWAGVPFYIRTGKSLARRTTEVAIQFKRAPFSLFRDTPVEKLRSNTLLLHIQPEEGLSLEFDAKLPGIEVRTSPVRTSFNYGDFFQAAPITGYETLLYDCMIGDGTLFKRADMVEAAWHAVTPILEAWEASPAGEFPNYAAGSQGPREADEMLARDGRAWRSI